MPTDRPPHLVLFIADTFRAWGLGCLGNPGARTPHLDRLAAEDGIACRQAFCQNPVCCPSRCSFTTGWYPHVRGHRTQNFPLQADEPSIFHALRGAGYRVWWGGATNHHFAADVPAERYCDVLHQPAPGTQPWFGDWEAQRDRPGMAGYYSMFGGRLGTGGAPHFPDRDWDTIAGACSFIVASRDDARPLCLLINLAYPHPPYVVEDPWHSAIDRRLVPSRILPPPTWHGRPAMMAGTAARLGLESWPETRWTELRAVYLAMCSRVDHQFGLVVDALRRADAYGRTGILAIGDHGDYTGDYGLVEKNQNTFQDCLTQVLCVAKPPAGRPLRPGVRDALVELVDVPATLADWAGIELPWTQFGRSLAPLIGGADRHRDAVFCEGGRLAQELHCAERESRGFTDTANIYWPRVSLQGASGPEHGKAAMIRTATHKYVRRPAEADELYDLVSDPQELVNRIADPALGTIREALRLRLLDHMLTTADVVPR